MNCLKESRYIVLGHRLSLVRLVWSGTVRSLFRYLLVGLLCYCFMQPTPLYAQDAPPVQEQPLVSQEIRYQITEAGEVFLIWGVDGWSVVPEAIRPAGTMIKDALLYTPMARKDDYFVVEVQVPAGATIDYVFLITKTCSGDAVEIWDANGVPKQDYHTIAVERGMVMVQASQSIVKQVTAGSPDVESPWLDLVLLIGVCMAFGAFAVQSLRDGFSIRGVLPTLRQLAATEQFQRGILWVIVLLGLVLRLRAAGEWNVTHPDSPERLWGDEIGYNSLALSILNGSAPDWPGRVPLYPLWLAGVHWLTKQSYSAIPYIQALLGITVIPLTHSLGVRVFGRGAALIAALLAATSFPLVHQSLYLLSEVLFTPMVLIVMITLWDATREPTPARVCWAGFWVGLSSLVRPTLLFFPLFSIVVYVIVLGKRQAIRYWAVYALVTLLFVTPWVVRNYFRYQAVFPLATNNGFLWLGSPEYYHLSRDEGYSYSETLTILFHPDRPELDPHSIEGDRYWTDRALRSISEEPLTYLRYGVEKIAFYWVGDPNADWGDTYVFNYALLRRWGHTVQEAASILFARVMPILALLASFVLRQRWRRLSPIYAILIYCTLLHAAAHAEARLSDPLQPLLMILVGGAVVMLWEAVAHRMRLEIPWLANRAMRSGVTDEPGTVET